MSPLPATQAKGHHFLEDMVACPSPLWRVNGLLVLRSRMNWPVGGKGPLSPVLAERITDALGNKAFDSFWTLFQAVPLRRLRVAGGHPGDNWLGIRGSRWKAAQLNPSHRMPLGEVSVSAPSVGAREGSRRPSRPPVFNREIVFPRGTFGHHSWERGAMASSGWKPGMRPNPPQPTGGTTQPRGSVGPRLGAPAALG